MDQRLQGACFGTIVSPESRMNRPAFAALLVAALVLTAWPAEQKKKIKQKEEEEPETQTLEILKDPPNAVVAETDRLVFRVTPLTPRGLLSRQVRDSLRWLLRQERGTVVKLRAFVAGSGDMRRVHTIVSEVFTEKRQPLPSLSVVQVGALPLEGAQVVIESVATARKPVNPHGVAFISGQAASVEEPLKPLKPLAEQSAAKLADALKAIGSDTGDMLRVTCYTSLVEDWNELRQVLFARFPQASVNLVQRLRDPVGTVVECEAVARLRTPPKQAVEFVNPPGLARAGRSEIALVAPHRIALTGTQLAFGFQESDARLAFERLGKTLEEVGASYQGIVMAALYPLSNSIAEQARKIGAEFYPKSGGRPPAATVLPSQGLPSLDAAFAIDVVALVERRL
jgi:enamine deaminase RidA (YjgF/YER057c/UK114 family)